MIPPSSTTSRRTRSTRRSARSREGGEDAKLLAGGHSLLPLMKLRLAAPTLLVDLRKVPGLHGHRARERRLADRGDDAPRRRSQTRGPRARRDGRRARSPTSRCATAGTIGGSLAHGDPASDLPAVLLALEGSVDVAGRRTASARSRPPTCSRTTSPRRSADDEVLTEVRLPALDGYGLRLPEVQPPRARTGRWSACARSSRRRRRHVRGRPHRAHAHGLDAAARDRRRGGAARAAARRRRASRRRPSRPPRAPTRPPTSTPTADYKRHLARVLTPESARGRVMHEVRAASPTAEAVSRGPGRRGLPRRPGSRHRRLPGRDARAAAAARGRGRRGQDRGRQGARRAQRRAADPAPVPRGHRPPPRASTTGTTSASCWRSAPPRRAPRRASCSAASSCCAARCWRRSSTTARSVLLIDEIDRADDEFEAFLLEFLADFAGHDPRARHGHGAAAARWSCSPRTARASCTTRSSAAACTTGSTTRRASARRRSSAPGCPACPEAIAERVCAAVARLRERGALQAARRGGDDHLGAGAAGARRRRRPREHARRGAEGARGHRARARARSARGCLRRARHRRALVAGSPRADARAPAARASASGELLAAHRALAAVDPSLSRARPFFALRAVLCSTPRRPRGVRRGVRGRLRRRRGTSRDPLAAARPRSQRAVLPRIGVPPEARPAPGRADRRAGARRLERGGAAAREGLRRVHGRRARARAAAARAARPARAAARSRAATRPTRARGATCHDLRAHGARVAAPRRRAARAPLPRARPQRPRRLVLVCDVSGSMEPVRAHAAAVPAGRASPPARGWRRSCSARGSRASRASSRGRDPDRALRARRRAVADWSGGTRIGAALAELNREHGRRIGRGAVVVVLSDGWDRGDPEQLADEMARLRRCAHRAAVAEPARRRPALRAAHARHAARRSRTWTTSCRATRSPRWRRWPTLHGGGTVDEGRLEDVEAWTARGDAVALATVIGVKRSAPRPPGSKMAVNERGEISGAVSGGCVEGAVVEVAEEVLSGGGAAAAALRHRRRGGLGRRPAVRRRDRRVGGALRAVSAPVRVRRARARPAGAARWSP